MNDSSKTNLTIHDRNEGHRCSILEIPLSCETGGEVSSSLPVFCAVVH